MSKGSINKGRFGPDVQKAIDRLSEDIYSGVRLPGARLVERELMSEFSLTRLKIRQALAELEAFGLVTIVHNRGATVADITIKRILEMYQFVSALEGAAARLAVSNIEERDILQLNKVIERQRAIKEGESGKWRELNNSFHRVIVLKCGNGELINTIRTYSQFTNYWFTAFAVPPMQENIKDHQLITDALVRKDREQAGAVMEAHVMKGGEYVIEYLEKNLPFILVKKD